MGFHRHATFAVLASAIADASGALPADVLRVGGSGTAFTKSAHRHEFDYDPKPGYLYVRSRAISSRTNDNFDTFPAHAIKEAWATFIGKPVFVNHHNADHRRMRGLIIDAALHEDTAPDGSPDTWVEVLMEVDAVRFPKLAEAVVKGHIDRTSMGTEVAKATCSFCGNVATNPAEYCRHIPKMKGQRIQRTTASGEKQSVLVSEICEGLHFFENSLLVEAPADPTAFTFGVDTRGLSNDPATASLVRAASLHAVARESEVVPFGRKSCAEPGCTRPHAPGSRLCAPHRWERERPKIDDLSDEDIFLAASLMEAEANMDFTDDEVLRAEAAMCAKCNPILAGITSDLCHPHAYQAKQEAEFGYSSADFGTHTAAAQGLPKHTYSVTLPDGKKATRTTTRDYSHVVLVNTNTAHDPSDYHAGQGWLYRSWHGDAVNARKSRDEASRWYGETHIAEVDNPRPASHYDKGGDSAPVGPVKCPRSGTSVTGRDSRGKSWSSQFEVECPDCGALVPNRKGKYGSHKPAKTATLHTAANWWSEDGEIYSLEVEGIGEATVAMEVAGNPTAHTGRWTYDAFAYDSLPDRLRGVAPTLAEAEAICERYLPEGQMTLASTAAKGAVAFGPVKSEHLGRCYELSGERAAFGGPGTTLVHGTIQGAGKDPIGHAWVEQADGTVWEPATDTAYHPGAFRALFNAKDEARYTPEEARTKMLATEHFGPWHEGRTASRHLAYGEQTAPPEVDTLRVDACPVCGDDNSFDGSQCRICGFIQPPDMFADPDLDRAKQVDLRGGDATEAAPAQLECDSCGATFDASANATNAAPAKPGIAATSAAFPFKKDDKAKDEQKDAPEQPKQDKAAPEQPDKPGDQTTPHKAGDTCPDCGEGTLAPVAPSGAQGGDQQQAAQPGVDPTQPAVPKPQDPQQDPQQDPKDPQQPPHAHPDAKADPNAEDPHAQDPNAGAAKPDHQQAPAPDPAAKPDQAAPKDPAAGQDQQSDQDQQDQPKGKDDEDDDKKKSAPPWLKKKTSSRPRAGTSKEDGVDAMTNPAQNARNRIVEALRSQQAMITAQAEEIENLRGAVVTIAKAAGIASHPKFASLVTAADENNEEVATSDAAALAPAAKDDPESVGAAPAAANTGVTPAATTDVQNTNVALPAEPFNNLTDVTAPTAGTDVPKGEAAHVDVDVRAGTPASNEPFPNNSGWKNASVEEDPQVRMMAALRLAKARKTAGIGGDVEELALCQSINDDRNISLASIQTEINTLTAVAAARTASAGANPAARSLVPQRAAAVQRTVPSLTAQAGAEAPVATSGAAKDNFLW